MLRLCSRDAGSHGPALRVEERSDRVGQRRPHLLVAKQLREVDLGTHLQPCDEVYVLAGHVHGLSPLAPGRRRARDLGLASGADRSGQASSRCAPSPGLTSRASAGCPTPGANSPRTLPPKPPPTSRAPLA